MNTAKIPTKEKVISEMEQSGIVPVFYHPDPVLVKGILRATYDAGLRVFEFTNRGEDALEVFKELIAYLPELPGMMLGAGTIWNKEDATVFRQAGAAFVVSPGTVGEIAKLFEEEDYLWVPGCGTITEIYTAREFGAGLIKMFPGDVLGPAFAKSVKSVLPDIKLMPTGGVRPEEENLADWFQAGVSCVGMGSRLFSREALDSRSFDQLNNDIKNAVTILHNVRQEL